MYRDDNVTVARLIEFTDVGPRDLLIYRDRNDRYGAPISTQITITLHLADGLPRKNSVDNQ